MARSEEVSLGLALAALFAAAGSGVEATAAAGLPASGFGMM
ncbi:hypothetical protein [Rhodopseudomonas sp. P2A-2r]|nr:hypothetical protein [Rhodopseudomonas sp. P2A-2r]